LKLRTFRLHAAISVIITPTNVCVVILLRSGLQLPCYIPLHLRDILTFLRLQGYRQSGQEEENRRGPDLAIKADGETLRCCAWPKFTDNLRSVTRRNVWCTGRCRNIILGLFRKNCFLKELQNNYTGLRLKDFLEKFSYSSCIFLCWNTKWHLLWTITYHFFTKSNFHSILICTVHTVCKYKIAQYSHNF
jgi:hypothetical protein